MPNISLSKPELIDQGRELAGLSHPNKAQRELLSYIVFRLRTRSMLSTVEIAHTLDVSVGKVSKIVSTTMDEVVKQTKLDAEYEIALQVQMLEHMFQEAYNAYLRSIGENVTLTEKGSSSALSAYVSGAIQDAINSCGNEEEAQENSEEGVKITRVTKMLNGDPRYLAEMRAILSDLRALKGIKDPPKDVNFHQVIDGSVEHIVTQGQPDNSKLDKVIQLLVSQGALPAPPGFDNGKPVIEAEYVEGEDEE